MRWQIERTSIVRYEEGPSATLWRPMKLVNNERKRKAKATIFGYVFHNKIKACNFSGERRKQHSKNRGDEPEQTEIACMVAINSSRSGGSAGLSELLLLWHFRHIEKLRGQVIDRQLRIS